MAVYRMVFRLLCLMLALLALAAVQTTPIQAQDAGGVTTTFTTRAKLRDGPGTEWYILGFYNSGTPIRLDGQAFAGNWVRGIVPDGKVGWVFSAALGLSRAEAAALPVVYRDDPFTLAAPAADAVPQPAVAVAQPEATAAPDDALVSTPIATVRPGVSSGAADNLVLPGVGPGRPSTNNNQYPFQAWNGDDGRLNMHDFFGGMAVYCVNSDFVPDDTYRYGGILVRATNGAELLYVPAATIANAWGQTVASGQATEIGSGGGVSALLFPDGQFQVNSFESSGKPTSFTWKGCRYVPRATNDNCAPGWDRNRSGECVHENLD